jgi:hypothetical protein
MRAICIPRQSGAHERTGYIDLIGRAIAIVSI